MPINYLAELTARDRTTRANLHMGLALAFVAGALNAGGFLAIGRYTSHMTGFVSMAADHLVLSNFLLAAAAGLSVLSFVTGSATTALLLAYARQRNYANLYAIPLLLEALLLLLFGVVGTSLAMHAFITISMTAILLSYVMGLQNALITKISGAQIRTTHLTGLVTDIGIELGRRLYWHRNQDRSGPLIIAKRYQLRVHIGLVLCFFAGGIAGAWGFKYAGYSATIPLALALVVMSTAPALQSRPRRRGRPPR